MLSCVFLFEQDKSWRVRYMVANQLYELCEAVGPEPTRCFFDVSSLCFMCSTNFPHPLPHDLEEIKIATTLVG